MNTFDPNDRELTVTTPDDPAYFLLLDGNETVPVEGVYRASCYICRDWEFAAMGLPLCQACPACSESEGDGVGHVPADDPECSDCGFDYQAWWEDNNS